MKDKDLLKALKDDGWEIVRTKVSHHIMQKNGKIEVVPVHGKDVPIGLLNRILKRTNLR